MTVDPTRSAHRSHRATSDDSDKTHNPKQPTADDLRRQAEARQRAMSEGSASASQLGSKASSPSNASWRKRLELDILKHLPPSNREIVRRAIVGYGGDKLYARGCNVAKQLSGFSEEQVKDILGMVRAGTGVEAAIAHERGELKRPVDYKEPASSKSTASTTSLKSQRTPVARARALANAVTRIRAHAGTTWSRLPVITRAAELQLGLVKSTTAPIETFNAVVDVVEDVSLDPLKRLGHEAGVTKGYLSGTVTQLYARTRTAYFTLDRTLENLGNAARNYQTAMSKNPPDVLAAQKAVAEANAASKLVDTQAARFYAFAHQLNAANKEFDHQVPHVVKEVLISAAAFGLGHGLAAEATEAEIAARKAAPMAEKALHAAKHGLKELATDRAVGTIVHKVEEGVKRIRETAR